MSYKLAVLLVQNFHGMSRAPDNFLKQGVADASLEAKGIFLQNAEVFFTPKFYTCAFL